MSPASSVTTVAPPKGSTSTTCPERPCLSVQDRTRRFSGRTPRLAAPSGSALSGSRIAPPAAVPSADIGRIFMIGAPSNRAT
jgi:hypothetical protein